MEYENDPLWAKKIFYSKEIQVSWQTHALAFAPLLTDAYPEDYAARLILVAALNEISSKNFASATRQLDILETNCTNDTDMAAILLFRGVCCEMEGKKDEMLTYYRKAGDLYPHFYWPYLKVAKMEHKKGRFQTAERNYLAAIRCLDTEKLSMQNKIVLASAYTNYASCLIMMHRPDDAEVALKQSEKVRPRYPDRNATWAMLHAIRGQGEQAEACLKILQKQSPGIHPFAVDSVEAILDKRHPHFFEVDIPQAEIEAFWTSFCRMESYMAEKMRNKEYDTVKDLLQSMLKPHFPFLEYDLAIGLQAQEDTFMVVLPDFYIVALHHAYSQFLAAKPSLENNWVFILSH